MSKTCDCQVNEVRDQENGVEVVLSEDATLEHTRQMVEECSSGSSTCCSPTFREKITEIEVVGIDGKVRIQIQGNVTAEDIKNNLSANDKEVE